MPDDERWKLAVCDACDFYETPLFENDPAKTVLNLVTTILQRAATVTTPEPLKSISIQNAGEPSISYTVAPDIYWRYDQAPHGSKVFLLTKGGVAVDGQWRVDGGFIAWHPLFKRDKELEAKLGIKS